MAHHSSNPDDPMRDELRKIFGDYGPTDLGATGRFPEGHLSDHDEGEIKMAVGVKGGRWCSTSAYQPYGSGLP